MAKRLKRAFTIVELVIVIAVIAILAAVLIPTFTTLIDKANESNDIALVKNLNTALVSKEATDEVNTMQDALDAAYEYGYTVDKLTPSSSGDIVWDEVNNRFALINDGKVVFGDGDVSEGASLWRIAKDTKDFSATYSNYLAGKWTEVPEASTGVDVGTNEGLDVTYTNTNTDAKQTVTIRTNGGTLTVNGPEDTVNHYGTAVKVVVTAVANESYHEYGEVLGNIELESGRVVVENNATVSTILVTAQSASSIKVEVNSNATVGTVAATKKDVITSENTTVPSTTDKVTEAVTVNKDFAGGLGTEKSPYLVATAGQFKNIEKLYAGKTKEGVTYTGETYAFKQAADIEIPSVVSGGSYVNMFTGVYDGNNFSISFAEDCVIKNYAWLFGIVFNQTSIKNLTIELNENQPVSMIYSSDWVTDTLTLTVENVTVDSNGKAVKANTTNFGFFGCFIIKNFDSIAFINCVNNADLINEGTSTGAFVGSGYIFYQGVEAKVEYKNCVNNGDITGASQAGVIYGNGAYAGVYDLAAGKPVAGVSDYEDGRFVIENFTNSGTILSLIDSGKAAFAPGSEKISNVSYTQKGSYVVGGYFDDKNVFVNQNGNSYQVNLQDETVSFKIAFNINLLDNGDGTVSNTTKYFYNIETDSTISSSNVLSHKAYDLAKAKEAFGQDIESKLAFDEQGIAFYTQDNVTYLIFRDKQIGRNPKTATPGETGVVVYVYAYNANGECVGVKTVK